MLPLHVRSALEEERNRAAEQRRAAESAAYERSRKVLEEEIGKDRAWRRAVEGVRCKKTPSLLLFVSGTGHWE